MPQVGHKLRVGGWVKTGREAGGGEFAFLEVNDGSTFSNLQARGRRAISSCFTGSALAGRAHMPILGSPSHR